MQVSLLSIYNELLKIIAFDKIAINPKTKDAIFRVIKILLILTFYLLAPIFWQLMTFLILDAYSIDKAQWAEYLKITKEFFSILAWPSATVLLFYIIRDELFSTLQRLSVFQAGSYLLKFAEKQDIIDATLKKPTADSQGKERENEESSKEQ